MGGRGSWSQTRSKPGNVKTKPGRKGQRKAIPMDITQFQGMSLQQIEGRLRGLDHEELFILDKDGNVTAAYKGDADSVAFPAVHLLDEGATVTHGHPVGAEGYGGTFSFADVLNMAASDWREHRAVASGPNEMNYIIRRTAATTEQNSRDLYNRIIQDIPMLEQQIRMSEPRPGTSSRELTPARRRQIYTGILDRYYSEVLPQYNFEYISRNEPYNYNR